MDNGIKIKLPTIAIKISNNLLFAAINKVPKKGKRCAEGVNDYLQNLGMKYRPFENLFSQKLQYAKDKTPIPGGIAIWNPAAAGTKNHKYGHVAIVKSVSPDGKKIRIAEWNGDGKSKAYGEREIPISRVTHDADGGGFYNPDFIVQAHQRQLAQAQAKNTGKDATSKEGQTAGETSTKNSADFSQEAQAYALDVGKGKIKLSNVPEKIRGQVQQAKIRMEEEGKFYLKPNDLQAKNVQSKINTLAKILKDESGMFGHLNNLSGTFQSINMNYITHGKTDILNQLKPIIQGDIIQNLIDAKNNGASFGALSDTELKLLKESAWELAAALEKWGGEGFDMSEGRFKIALKNLQERYQDVYDKMTGKKEEDLTKNLHF